MNLDQNQTIDRACGERELASELADALRGKYLMRINVAGVRPPENGPSNSARLGMYAITDFMAGDHRACDALLVAVEQAVAKGAWEAAGKEFRRFHDAMLHHFAAEEELLFALFEQRTGMYRGPTQVMRGEHSQVRQLLAAAQSALAESNADDYAGTAETLLIMLQQHNVKEENVLYPMCDQYLADQLETLLPELQKQIAGEERLSR